MNCYVIYLMLKIELQITILIKVIGNFYCENEILDAKVILWSHSKPELDEKKKSYS